MLPKKSTINIHDAVAEIQTKYATNINVIEQLLAERQSLEEKLHDMEERLEVNQYDKFLDEGDSNDDYEIYDSQNQTYNQNKIYKPSNYSESYTPLEAAAHFDDSDMYYDFPQNKSRFNNSSSQSKSTARRGTTPTRRSTLSASLQADTDRLSIFMYYLEWLILSTDIYYNGA